MIGINDVTANPISMDIARIQGRDFYFIFPEDVIQNGARCMQMIVRKPDDPEITGDAPAVRVLDMLKLFAH